MEGIGSFKFELGSLFRKTNVRGGHTLVNLNIIACGGHKKHKGRLGANARAFGEIDRFVRFEWLSISMEGIMKQGKALVHLRMAIWPLGQSEVGRD